MSKAAELASLIGNINAGGGGVNRNLLINGDMAVAQRDTSATTVDADGYYTCDRWKYIDESTGGQVTLTQDSSVPTGSGLSKSFKVDCTTADASVAAAHSIRVQQRIEGQNLQSVAKGTSDAKPLVCSFYVKSNLTGQFNMYLEDTDNSRAIAGTYTISSANTWEFKTVRFPADTTGAFTNDNAMSLVLHFFLAAGTNFTSGTIASAWQSKTLANLAVGMSNNILSSTSNDWAMAGVQLEVGQNPTEFEHEPIGVTFDKCERYLQVFAQDNANAHVASGYYHSTTSLRCHMPFRQKMRAVPTGSIVNVGDFFVQDGGATAAPSAIATANNNDTSMLTVTTSSRTAGNGGALLSDESSSIRMDAEL